MVAQAITSTEVMGWLPTSPIKAVAFKQHNENPCLVGRPVPFAFHIVAPQKIAPDVKKTIQVVLNKKGADLRVVDVEMQDEHLIGILAEDQLSFNTGATLRHHLDDINIALGEQKLPQLADIPVQQEPLIK